MYSEQLALMLFMAATQLAGTQIKPPSGPMVEDGRQAMIRAVKEPELVAALSLRAKRSDLRKLQSIRSHTLLARID